MTKAAAKKVREALELLAQLDVPREQQNERSALTLLVLADLIPPKTWSNAAAPLRRITEMMDWMAANYGVQYAPNTRETIRRQTVHQFVQIGLLLENPDEPDRPINSPKWCYQLSPLALELIRGRSSEKSAGLLKNFRKGAGGFSLQARHRDLPRVEVTLPGGMRILLSAGGQKTLIRQIVEEFTPRFVRKPKVLLIGDAADKEVGERKDRLRELGIELPERGKSPDVLIHDQERDWLIVVEAVTSHGPIDQKRKNELESLLAGSRAGLVFVTAFPDRKTFTRFQAAIAWETEVWVADAPDHLIHFNGERFLGPYK